MNSNWIAIALAAGIFLYGYILWMAMRRPIASGMRRLRNLPRSIQALLVVIAVIATVEAQKASTNNTGNAGNTNMMSNVGIPLGGGHFPILEPFGGSGVNHTLQNGGNYTLTTNDVLNGYRVVSRIYAEDVELPSNAVIVGTWNMHGAATPFGNNKIDFPGFPFQFGPEGTESESVWVSPWGSIRPKPHDENGEINTGLGEVVAQPGESVLARSEGENGSQSLWWWHFYQLPDTNTPLNAAITLYQDGTYGTLATNVWEYCVPIRPQAWLSISAPSVLVLNGNSNMVSAVFSAPYNVDATPTIECVKGEGLLDIATIDGHTLSVRGIAKSSYVGDIEFSASVVVCGKTYTVTHAMTVATVDKLLMSSNAEEMGVDDPPFMGATQYPFNPKNTLNPGKHLLIPFDWARVLGSLIVGDVTVSIQLVLDPAVSPDVDASWRVIENTTDSGTLVATGGLTAEFRNPTCGGVIRIAASCDGSPETEGNILLPLAGATIDAVFESDFIAASNAVAYYRTYWPRYVLTPLWGAATFYKNGDYHGRVDCADYPTVRAYNSISDDDFHFGAVATLYGAPVRIAKLSNFLVSYVTAALNVNEMFGEISRTAGTEDDESAAMSWEAGALLATNGLFSAVVPQMATNMFLSSDGKVTTLWPNQHPTDNHLDSDLISNFDENFCSPIFIEESRARSGE